MRLPNRLLKAQLDLIHEPNSETSSKMKGTHLFLIVFISVFITATSTLNNAWTTVPSITGSVRATLEDVDHKFMLGYNFGEGCPTKYVNIRKSALDGTEVGRVLVKDIRIDGKKCKACGADDMSIVPEDVAKDRQLMEDVGFEKVLQALEKNRAAKITLHEKTVETSFILGHINGDLKCGKYTQDNHFIWFFIREPEDFHFVVQESESKWTSVTIPKNARCLMMLANDKLCLLIDHSLPGNHRIVHAPFNPKKNSMKKPGNTPVAFQVA